MGVIAGRRRLFALKKKAKERGIAQTAPCVVMESGNVKAAREASLLENVARVPATMLEQFAAYKGLADSAQMIEQIADIFVIKPKQVKRILALANLNSEILALYEADNIRRNTVEALTLATAVQQVKWLALYENEDEYAPQGHQLKDWLTGGAQIETKTAIFDLEGFEGAIITDLFGDTDYFADPEQFWPRRRERKLVNIGALFHDESRVFQKVGVPHVMPSLCQPLPNKTAQWNVITTPILHGG